MKRHYNWSQIEASLGRLPHPEPGPAADFWERFRARAELMPQDGDGNVPARPAPILGFVGFSRVAALAASVVLAGVLVVLWMRPGSLPLAGAASQTIVNGPHRAQNEVRSVEVLAPNNGVMIMGDESSPGTVIWIAGLEAPATTKEAQ